MGALSKGRLNKILAKLATGRAQRTDPANVHVRSNFLGVAGNFTVPCHPGTEWPQLLEVVERKATELIWKHTKAVRTRVRQSELNVKVKACQVTFKDANGIHVELEIDMDTMRQHPPPTLHLIVHFIGHECVPCKQESKADQQVVLQAEAQQQQQQQQQVIPQPEVQQQQQQQQAVQQAEEQQQQVVQQAEEQQQQVVQQAEEQQQQVVQQAEEQQQQVVQQAEEQQQQVVQQAEEQQQQQVVLQAEVQQQQAVQQAEEQQQQQAPIIVNHNYYMCQRSDGRLPYAYQEPYQWAPFTAAAPGLFVHPAQPAGSQLHAAALDNAADPGAQPGAALQPGLEEHTAPGQVHLMFLTPSPALQQALGLQGGASRGAAAQQQGTVTGQEQQPEAGHVSAADSATDAAGPPRAAQQSQGRHDPCDSLPMQPQENNAELGVCSETKAHTATVMKHSKSQAKSHCKQQDQSVRHAAGGAPGEQLHVRAQPGVKAISMAGQRSRGGQRQQPHLHNDHDMRNRCDQLQPGEAKVTARKRQQQAAHGQQDAAPHAGASQAHDSADSLAVGPSRKKQKTSAMGLQADAVHQQAQGTQLPQQHTVHEHLASVDEQPQAGRLSVLFQLVWDALRQYMPCEQPLLLDAEYVKVTRWHNEEGRLCPPSQQQYFKDQVTLTCNGSAGLYDWRCDQVTCYCQRCVAAALQSWQQVHAAAHGLTTAELVYQLSHWHDDELCSSLLDELLGCLPAFTGPDWVEACLGVEGVADRAWLDCCTVPWLLAKDGRPVCARQWFMLMGYNLPIPSTTHDAPMDSSEATHTDNAPISNSGAQEDVPWCDQWDSSWDNAWDHGDCSMDDNDWQGAMECDMEEEEEEDAMEQEQLQLRPVVRTVPGVPTTAQHAHFVDEDSECDAAVVAVGVTRKAQHIYFTDSVSDGVEYKEAVGCSRRPPFSAEQRTPSSTAVGDSNATSRANNSLAACRNKVHSNDARCKATHSIAERSNANCSKSVSSSSSKDPSSSVTTGSANNSQGTPATSKGHERVGAMLAHPSTQDAAAPGSIGHTHQREQDISMPHGTGSTREAEAGRSASRAADTSQDSSKALGDGSVASKRSTGSSEHKSSSRATSSSHGTSSSSGTTSSDGGSRGTSSSHGQSSSSGSGTSSDSGPAAPGSNLNVISRDTASPDQVMHPGAPDTHSDGSMPSGTDPAGEDSIPSGTDAAHCAGHDAAAGITASPVCGQAGMLTPHTQQPDAAQQAGLIASTSKEVADCTHAAAVCSTGAGSCADGQQVVRADGAVAAAAAAGHDQDPAGHLHAGNAVGTEPAVGSADVTESAPGSIGTDDAPPGSMHSPAGSASQVADTELGREDVGGGVSTDPGGACDFQDVVEGQGMAQEDDTMQQQGADGPFHYIIKDTDMVAQLDAHAATIRSDRAAQEAFLKAIMDGTDQMWDGQQIQPSSDDMVIGGMMDDGDADGRSDGNDTDGMDPAQVLAQDTTGFQQQTLCDDGQAAMQTSEEPGGDLMGEEGPQDSQCKAMGSEQVDSDMLSDDPQGSGRTPSMEQQHVDRGVRHRHMRYMTTDEPAAGQGVAADASDGEGHDAPSLGHMAAGAGHAQQQLLMPGVQATLSYGAAAMLGSPTRPQLLVGSNAGLRQFSRRITAPGPHLLRQRAATQTGAASTLWRQQQQQGDAGMSAAHVSDAAATPGFDFGPAIMSVEEARRTALAMAAKRMEKGMSHEEEMAMSDIPVPDAPTKLKAGISANGRLFMDGYHPQKNGAPWQRVTFKQIRHLSWWPQGVRGPWQDAHPIELKMILRGLIYWLMQAGIEPVTDFNTKKTASQPVPIPDPDDKDDSHDEDDSDRDGPQPGRALQQRSTQRYQAASHKPGQKRGRQGVGRQAGRSSSKRNSLTSTQQEQRQYSQDLEESGQDADDCLPAGVAHKRPQVPQPKANHQQVVGGASKQRGAAVKGGRSSLTNKPAAAAYKRVKAASQPLPIISGTPHPLCRTTQPVAMEDADEEQEAGEVEKEQESPASLDMCDREQLDGQQLLDAQQLEGHLPDQMDDDGLGEAAEDELEDEGENEGKEGDEEENEGDEGEGDEEGVVAGRHLEAQFNEAGSEEEEEGEGEDEATPAGLEHDNGVPADQATGEAAAPTDEAHVPADESAAPADKAPGTTHQAAAPADEAAAPTDWAAVPVDEAAAPADSQQRRRRSGARDADKQKVEQRLLAVQEELGAWPQMLSKSIAQEWAPQALQPFANFQALLQGIIGWPHDGYRKAAITIADYCTMVTALDHPAKPTIVHLLYDEEADVIYHQQCLQDLVRHDVRTVKRLLQQAKRRMLSSGEGHQ